MMWGMGCCGGWGMFLGGADGIRMQAFHSIPAKYARMTSPLDPTPEHIAVGGKLYEQYCATCHGSRGWSDGPAGQQLNPPPTPLAHTVAMPMTTDGYLFWRIQKGGQAFGSAMPAWEGVLNDEQIWKIILYMRAGFPPLEEENSHETPKTPKGGCIMKKNRINLKALEETREKILRGEFPEKKEFLVEGQWLVVDGPGQFKATLEYPRGTVELVTDQPPPSGGEGTAPNPV